MDYRKYYYKRFWGHLFSMPFIWLPLPFLLISDLVMELYQQICFPVYGIAKVKRKDYILIRDRNKLKYLYGFEKLGCMYCGYANGVIAYWREIAGRPEKYWCGIMHENKPGFKTQEHQIQQNFSVFGDEKDFKEKYPDN